MPTTKPAIPTQSVMFSSLLPYHFFAAISSKAGRHEIILRIRLTRSVTELAKHEHPEVHVKAVRALGSFSRAEDLQLLRELALAPDNSVAAEAVCRPSLALLHQELEAFLNRYDQGLYAVALAALGHGEEAAYALDPTRRADVAPRALCATLRRTGQIHPVVALRIIADPGHCGMNPQVLSNPELTEIDTKA